MVAAMRQVENGHRARGLTSAGEHRPHPALQRRNALLHRIERRIAQARIEVAPHLQVKEVRHMLRGIELKGGALIDRHHTRLAILRLPAGLNALGLKLHRHLSRIGTKTPTFYHKPRARAFLLRVLGGVQGERGGLGAAPQRPWQGGARAHPCCACSAYLRTYKRVPVGCSRRGGAPCAPEGCGGEQPPARGAGRAALPRGAGAAPNGLGREARERIPAARARRTCGPTSECP